MTAIHHVFATKSNVGDWLSARGIQQLLHPLRVTEHLCDEPFVDETLSRLSAVDAGDLVVLGGGGLFMDYFTRFWQGFREISGRFRYCIWGVGYCDVKTSRTRPPEELLRDVVSGSELCVVRDELTRRHLQRDDLPAPVPCPSMVAVERPAAAGHGIVHADHYDVVGPENHQLLAALARRFAARTGRPYWETDNQIRDGDENDLRSVLDRYARADLVVSSRLHGCIIGLAMGRKVLAVSGDHKIDAFMRAAGLGDWVCDTRDLSGLEPLIEALPAQRTPWQLVEAARAENLRVAARVRAMAGSSTGGGSP